MILDKLPAHDDCTALAADPNGLTAIKNPACAATVWQRAPLARFQRWIDALPPEQLPRARMILRPEAVCDALINIARQCGTPESSECNLLIEDASALASIFANLMNTTYLRLRFDVINTNACRKFHIDAVTARLVCTYRGTGTQYGLSEGGQEPEQIMTVPTGSPIILRGTRWPETPVSGLLHRSPPIVGTGETRLLLVLDPVEEPEKEAETAYIH
ncbi:DUF1826 domain-containing protein [Roseovarius sp. MMSF_3281]|uniref:DUF1826 domain-containing protein n=1 Tax=Roseovarius sp. MMSF_3281 TaxID=3046694 RepID=UPI00273E056B|nr:DUF1826 domain-containing protein [Roseovarius sp. MMSF_3281]